MITTRLPDVLPEVTISYNCRTFSHYTQCRDKVRYFTFDTAHAEAVRLAGIEPKYIFTIYLCPHCNHLHIGRVMKRFNE